MPQKTNRPLTVVGLMAALAMGALEATVVSTAMPTVIGELHGIKLYAGVTTAYLLASTVMVPIFGKLADVYGRKPIILIGIALFLFGSAASGMAQSMEQLIAFRAVQGLGAGAMQPMALTIVGDIFDLEERARMQGVFGSVWGVSGLLGPLLAPLIVDHLGWRWIFYINVPLGVAAALLIQTQLAESVEKKRRRIDFAGFATLTVTVVSLMVAAGGAGAWLFGVSAAFLVVFLVIERRAEEPVLPLPLFARRVIAVSSVAGAVIGGAMIATLTYVPLYVQGVLGEGTAAVGLSITPMVIGWPVASALGGRLLPRVGFRPLVWGGFAVTALGALGLYLLAPTMGLGVLRASMLIFGVGMGFANTALLIAVQTSVAWDLRGVATASTMFFRTIGGALAVAAMGAVLNAALTKDVLRGAPLEAVSAILGPEHGRGLPSAQLESLSAALSSGLSTVFAIIAVMAVATFFVSLAFPKIEGQLQKAPAPAGH